MPAKKKELSNDIYHKIYRLSNKKIPINQIAATLKLPFSAVKSVVDRFTYTNNDSEDLANGALEDSSYLDIYILQRLRYSIIDLNGMIITKHLAVLQAEFDRIYQSDLKVVAILMANVKELDDNGWSSIMIFYQNFLNKGRYTAILDPSQEVEEYITQKDLEKIIPVFGTEKAFEDNAFKTKRQL